MGMFFKELDGLSSGDRVVLKRSAGVQLESSQGRALRVFYQHLPYGVDPRLEGRWYACACIHCLWPGGTAPRIDFVQAVSLLCRDDAISSSAIHRLEAILDMDWDQSGYMLTKLCRFVKLIKSRGYAIDCAGLLSDLIWWNADDQRVQRRWARSVYGKESDQKAEKGE